MLTAPSSSRQATGTHEQLVALGAEVQALIDESMKTLVDSRSGGRKHSSSYVAVLPLESVGSKARLDLGQAP